MKEYLEKYSNIEELDDSEYDSDDELDELKNNSENNFIKPLNNISIEVSNKLIHNI